MVRKDIHKGTEKLTQFLESIEENEPERKPEEMDEGKKGVITSGTFLVERGKTDLGDASIDIVIKDYRGGGVGGENADSAKDLVRFSLSKSEAEPILKEFQKIVKSLPKEKEDTDPNKFQRYR